MFRFYDMRSRAGLVSHFVAATTVAGVAVAAAPLWLVGGVIGFQLLQARNLIKHGGKDFEKLREHAESPIHSPNLQTMVDRLYLKSGLNRRRSVVYTFQEKTEMPPVGRLPKMPRIPRRPRFPRLSDFNGIGRNYNAGAFHMGKPYIMISEPLLEILEDDEEEAVLAHEFLHAAAGHSYTMLGSNLLTAVTKTTNNLNLLVAATSMGLVNFALFAAGGAFGFKALSSSLNLRAMQAGATLCVCGAAATMVPGFGAMLGVLAMMNVGALAINKSYSRSMEYHVDRKVGDLGANPLALIRALRKIDHMVKVSGLAGDFENREELSRLTVKGVLTTVLKGVVHAFSTHPPLKARLAQMEKVALKAGYSREEVDQALYGELKIGNIGHIPKSHIENMANALIGGYGQKVSQKIPEAFAFA